MQMEELGLIEAPVSDATQGLIAGVALGIGLVGLAIGVAALC
jgi:hypothetical protein